MIPNSNPASGQSSGSQYSVPTYSYSSPSYPAASAPAAAYPQTPAPAAGYSSYGSYTPYSYASYSSPAPASASASVPSYQPASFSSPAPAAVQTYSSPYTAAAVPTYSTYQYNAPTQPGPAASSIATAAPVSDSSSGQFYSVSLSSPTAQYSSTASTASDSAYYKNDYSQSAGSSYSSAPPASAPFPTATLPSSSNSYDSTVPDSSGPDSIDDTISASEYLTSYSILNNSSLLSSFPLPLGALISPFTPLTPSPPVTTTLPPRCFDCGAYLNTFCDFLPHTNQWICCFCETRNFAPNLTVDSMPNSKIVEVQGRNQAEYGVANAVGPESSESAAPQDRPLHFLIAVDESLDSSSLSALSDALNAAIRSSFHSPNYRFSLISFSSHCTLYDLKTHEFALGIAKKYHPIQWFNWLQQLEIQEQVAKQNENQQESKNKSNQTEIQQGISHFIGDSNDFEHLIQILQAMADASTAADEENSSSAAEALLKHRCIEPAIALAIQLARRSFAQGFLPRLLLFTGGPPTAELEPPSAGPQARFERWKRLGEQFSLFHGTAHTFSLHEFPIDSRLFRHFLQPVGGDIYSHASWAAPSSFAEDFHKILFREMGTQGRMRILASSALKIDRILGKLAPSRDSSRLHRSAESKSSGLDEFAYTPQFLLDSTGSDRVTEVSFQFSTVKPDETLSLLYSLRDSLSNALEFVYFQFQSAYRSFTGVYHTRIITRKVRVTGSLKTFLQSFDPETAAALTCKFFCLRALKENERREAMEEDSAFSSIGMGGKNRDSDDSAFAASPSSSAVVQKEIQDLLSDLFRFSRSADVEAILKIEQQYYPPDSRPDSLLLHQFPSVLREIPEFLYHFSRGPLLGSILQHGDELERVRQRFLTANRTESLRFVVPALTGIDFSTADPKAADGQFQLQKLPLATLSLRKNRILFLDAGNEVLVWSGSAVAGADFDAYREALKSRAERAAMHRCPAPEVKFCREGDSASRALTCRLFPIHRDPSEFQMSQYPELQSMNDAERHAISKLCPITEEAGFYQFLQEAAKQR